MALPARLSARWVAVISLLAALAFGLLRLAQADWDPVGLAEIGTRFAVGDPDGSEGYDGQFAYYIAANPDPQQVAPHLDVPAYRYQRILYPLTARFLALGMPSFVPWTLFLLNLAAHALGTWAVARWLALRGSVEVYALAYGLWVGLIGAVGLDLNEPLAYALVAGAWLVRGKQMPKLGATLLTLALFAKETTILFLAAALAADAIQKRWRDSVVWLGIGGALFGIWQAWLWLTFGRPGLGAGGAMATPFEWIPFMGLARIGLASLGALMLYLLIFGPSIVLPAVWGVVASLRDVLRRKYDAEAFALLINSAAIAFLPFSTFREPLGLVRMASGLVLAVVCHAALRGNRRAQNYSLFWIALLALLAQS